MERRLLRLVYRHQTVLEEELVKVGVASGGREQL